jgi:hypothetical protein
MDFLADKAGAETLGGMAVVAVAEQAELELLTTGTEVAQAVLEEVLV